MKNYTKCFLLGSIIIMSSSPLGRILINALYMNKNLVSEYIPIMNGFIYSIMIVGILVFVVGILDLFTKKCK